VGIRALRVGKSAESGEEPGSVFEIGQRPASHIDHRRDILWIIDAFFRAVCFRIRQDIY
jgi:hypothetical protein